MQRMGSASALIYLLPQLHILGDYFFSTKILIVDILLPDAHRHLLRLIPNFSFWIVNCHSWLQHDQHLGPGSVRESISDCSSDTAWVLLSGHLQSSCYCTDETSLCIAWLLLAAVVLPQQCTCNHLQLPTMSWVLVHCLSVCHQLQALIRRTMTSFTSSLFELLDCRYNLGGWMVIYGLRNDFPFISLISKSCCFTLHESCLSIVNI